MQIIESTSAENAEDGNRWDAYVGKQTSTVTDLWAWRQVVKETCTIGSLFLLAIESDRIVGGLGLFEVRHAFFGHYLTTAPFSNDGGLYFDNNKVRDALLQKSKQIANRLDVDYLLIRTRLEALDGFEVDKHYQTALIDLSSGSQEIWNKLLPSKTRNQVRRGMNEKFSIETGHEQLFSFFEVYHQAIRDLGSPAHDIRFYQSLIQRLGDNAEFYVVRDGHSLVGGALLFWINGTAMNYHTIVLHKYNRRCPNYLLYWKMIEASCKRRCTCFDMGRSVVGSSNLAFKMNWSPKPLPLFYNYYLRKLKKMPYIDPRNPRYRIPIEIWKRLPVCVSKKIGTLLISGIT